MRESGAITDQDKYSELFLRITRAAGLLVPFVAVGYGMASAVGLGARSPYYSFTGFSVIAALFIILGIAQLIHKPHTPRTLGVYIALYHIIGATYLIVGPGLLSPIAFCWIILALITEIFYGRILGAISLALITLVGVFLLCVQPALSFAWGFQYTIYLSIIIVSSILVILLRSVQRVEHQDLKRAQLHEQLQRDQLTALINSVGVAIISTSYTGTIRVYNAAVLNLLDTNQSLSGRRIEDVLHLHDQHDEPVSLLSIFTGRQQIVERDDLSHRFADGETIRLSISAAPIRGHFSGGTPGHEGYIFILRDITKAKSLEEERDEFISVVSHELRTPVAIAEGTLSNLQFLLEKQQDPTQLEAALKDAHEQVIYLASMVNDLSTLSRAERGTADTPETIDLKELLQELYHRYHKRAESKKLQFDLQIGPHIGKISTSRLYLEEILQNFLTNAIKYTQEGSIHLSATRVSGGVEFAVQDSGIGISKADQKRIFEKFYRSEDYRTRETSGNGLGLYVVKKLAHKLNVEIGVESRLNHGSTFSFTLPAHPAPVLTKEK